MSHPAVGSGFRSAPKQASVVEPRVAGVDPTVPFQATLPWPAESSFTVPAAGTAAAAAPLSAHRDAAVARAAAKHIGTLPPMRLTEAGKLPSDPAEYAGQAPSSNALRSSSNAGYETPAASIPSTSTPSRDARPPTA